MTGVEFFVTYAVCWWLVLFMVLPHQVKAPENPGLGHAPSAPENPRLRKKFAITTLLAFIPAIFFYFLVGQAYAADTVYHAGSECKPMEAYKPSADLDAKDGFGLGDNKLQSATLDGQNFLGDKSQFDIPLNIPSANYNQSGNSTVDLSESFVGVGKLSVGMDGSAKLNDKSITGQSTFSEDCAKKAKPTEADMLKTK